MNQATYLQKLKQTFIECLQLVETKSSDYATDEDPFKNFRASEVAGVSVEQGILIRLLDKISRLANIINKDKVKIKVKDERIQDTLMDIINYSNILKIYIDDKDGEGEDKSSNNNNNNIKYVYEDEDESIRRI